MKTLSAFVIALVIALGYMLIQYPCRDTFAASTRPTFAQSPVTNHEKSPTNCQNCVEDDVNQYGETELGVQTRIADASDITACWSIKLGMAAIAISVLAFLIGLVQWVSSNRTTKKQLRAYISTTGKPSVKGTRGVVGDSRMQDSVPHDLYEASIEVFNSGQTRATHVRIVVDLLGNWPGVGGLKTKRIDEGFRDLGAGEKRTLEFKWRHFVITNGQWYNQVIGWITYRDVFDDEWKTPIKYSLVFNEDQSFELDDIPVSIREELDSRNPT